MPEKSAQLEGASPPKQQDKWSKVRNIQQSSQVGTFKPEKQPNWKYHSRKSQRNGKPTNLIAGKQWYKNLITGNI